jgi:hypothetical protein
MNRVILIGNGFDLAHGLKTSYKDFIDDFWEKEKQKVVTGLVKEYTDGFHYHYKYEDDFISVISPCLMSELHHSVNINGRGYNWFLDLVSSGIKIMLNGVNVTFHVEFKNIFLKIITENTTLQDWVNIELEYYLALNLCLNEKYPEGIKKLNQEFSSIQKALEEYLTLQTTNNIKTIQNVQEIFNKIVQNIIIDKTLTKFGRYEILFLNFNYTNTINIYSHLFSESNIDVKYINIHGELNNTENPIMFGYGDEIDDNYKHIKDNNDKRYLENIKSIKYLETNNYKKLLNFISGSEYQIFIMGHSCGISDRTLLNMLFENNNCTSINIFYHEYENGSDNYIDLIKDIYRNFTNNSLMRKIVADKTICMPLS